MKIKNLLVSTIVVFIFIFIFEFLFHGILLKDLYLQTSNLWRTENEMQQYFPWAIICQIIGALIISLIYLQKHENKGWTEGLRFGAIIGSLLGVTVFGFYAYMPIPLILASAWLVGSLIEVTSVGIILSLINLQKK
ncbi:MAG: hypothetical protein QNJ31_07455 [Candidatus Caenarcaniphilales bacterium]|nr:hypothetical protein [Candidatus Caenarcaniphilales bacterium]